MGNPFSGESKQEDAKNCHLKETTKSINYILIPLNFLVIISFFSHHHHHQVPLFSPLKEEKNWNKKGNWQTSLWFCGVKFTSYVLFFSLSSGLSNAILTLQLFDSVFSKTKSNTIYILSTSTVTNNNISILSLNFSLPNNSIRTHTHTHIYTHTQMHWI